MAVHRVIGAVRSTARRTHEHTLAVDVALAVLCYLTAAVPEAAGGSVNPWLLLGMAGNAAPLIWRRRWPIQTAAVVGVFTTVLAMVDAVGRLPYAQLVATYTFAMLCPPLWRALGIAATAAGITVSVMVPGDPFFNAPVVAAAFGCAYALGTSARARQDRIALLEERNRRMDQEHAAIAAGERERIARDMHDTLAHAMSLVAVQAEAGPLLVRRDPDRAARAFDSIASAAHDALAQLRRTLGVLRSGGPDRGPGLAPHPGLDGIDALAERAGRAGLTVSVARSGRQVPVPADVGAAAYRIVQESVTNTVRHAAAARLWIGLGWTGDALRVQVSDDGRGPAPPMRRAPDGTGHGLIGMRERIRALGGTLRTGPGAGGRGFQVTASLPLRPPAGEPARQEGGDAVSEGVRVDG